MMGLGAFFEETLNHCDPAHVKPLLTSKNQSRIDPGHATATGLLIAGLKAWLCSVVLIVEVRQLCSDKTRRRRDGIDSFLFHPFLLSQAGA